MALAVIARVLLGVACGAGLNVRESDSPVVRASKRGANRGITSERTRFALPPPALVSVDDTVNYSSFVRQVVGALRERVLPRKSSLQYFLESVVRADETVHGGEWVEFGVYRGESMNRIVRRRRRMKATRPVHGFDSFLGLPADWRAAADGDEEFTAKYTGRGAFTLQGKPPFNDSMIQWHIGWFNETAGAFAKDPASLAAGNITFLHMDADMYSSTAQAFEALESRIAPGAYIVFDELVGYVEYQEHEMKALYELLRRTRRTLEVIGYPGPYILESPEDIKNDICAGSENKDMQNVLVRIV